MASRSRSSRSSAAPTPGRIRYLKVENFRALQSIELKDLTPLTVLVGPNGSGKSTVLDVFSFLSEFFEFGLRHAWDRRGGAKELHTRGRDGPVTIELVYRENLKLPAITYRLSVEEGPKGPEVATESLCWARGSRGRPFRFLDFSHGNGSVIGGEMPEDEAKRTHAELRSADRSAVSLFGKLADHPRIAALSEFITDWYASRLSVENMRGQPEAGPQERLSETGDNIANVVEYFEKKDPKRLEEVLSRLRLRIPLLDRVLVKPTSYGRLSLQIKETPFPQPESAWTASYGTLKMLAYLLVLDAPIPPQLIVIDEPENSLHPGLLQGVAEECRAATGRSQLLVATHSPFFVNGLRPEEVRVLYRTQEGFTRMVRVSEVPGIREFLDQGALLGHLWTENHFGVGDPLVNAGAPVIRR